MHILIAGKGNVNWSMICPCEKRRSQEKLELLESKEIIYIRNGICFVLWPIVVIRTENRQGATRIEFSL